MTTPCKIIVLVGQTASGKTATAIKLAKAIDGEIISADSRQVYTGLNIGADKIQKEEMQGIPHHLIDVANPTSDKYTVSNFVDDARIAIADMCARGKTPIVAGGTMLYIDALFNRIQFPNVPPNLALRAQLEEKSAEELHAILMTKDPERASAIEPQNKRRVIRALEILEVLDAVPQVRVTTPPENVLYIGLYNNEDEQKAKIEKRNAEMLENGLLKEVRSLHTAGVPWERFKEFGFEYAYPAQALVGEITKDECLQKMNSGTWRYARKQKKWWKDRPEIHWFTTDEFPATMSVVSMFLRS